MFGDLLWTARIVRSRMSPELVVSYTRLKELTGKIP